MRHKRKLEPVQQQVKTSADSVIPVWVPHLFVIIGVVASSALLVSLLPTVITSSVVGWYNAAGEYRQAQWDWFLDNVCDDEKKMWTYGSIFAIVVWYWFLGGIYTFLDLTNKPDALRRYKVQPGKNEPLEVKTFMKVLGTVLFNQLFITVPAAFHSAHTMVDRRGTPDFRVLPPIHTAFLHILFCILMEEIGFYYSHRLFHYRWFYKYFHKKHHEFTAPIAVVAIYAHPLEHVLSNMIPTFLGVIILGTHVTTGITWLIIMVSFTLTEHSGYHIPFLISPERHDYHHLTFNNCFGVLGLLDGFHKTDEQFRKSQQNARHSMLTSLRSAREVHPDSKQHKTN